MSQAYIDMFKGSIVNPEVLQLLVLEPPMPSGNVPTWQTALRPLSETLTNAAPLIFTGLAVAIPFRAGLFNIGGQGQAIMGAIGGGTVGLALSLPAVHHIPLAMLAGALSRRLLGRTW